MKFTLNNSFGEIFMNTSRITFEHRSRRTEKKLPKHKKWRIEKKKTIIFDIWWQRKVFLKQPLIVTGRRNSYNELNPQTSLKYTLHRNFSQFRIWNSVSLSRQYSMIRCQIIVSIVQFSIQIVRDTQTLFNTNFCSTIAKNPY